MRPSVEYTKTKQTDTCRHGHVKNGTERHRHRVRDTFRHNKKLKNRNR